MARAFFPGCFESSVQKWPGEGPGQGRPPQLSIGPGWADLPSPPPPCLCPSPLTLLPNGPSDSKKSASFS